MIGNQSVNGCSRRFEEATFYVANEERIDSVMGETSVLPWVFAGCMIQAAIVVFSLAVGKNFWSERQGNGWLGHAKARCTSGIMAISHLKLPHATERMPAISHFCLNTKHTFA